MEEDKQFAIFTQLAETLPLLHPMVRNASEEVLLLETEFEISRLSYRNKRAKIESWKLVNQDPNAFIESYDKSILATRDENLVTIIAFSCALALRHNVLPYRVPVAEDLKKWLAEANSDEIAVELTKRLFADGQVVLQAVSVISIVIAFAQIIDCNWEYIAQKTIQYWQTLYDKKNKL